MRLQQGQELLQGGIVIVGTPIGDIANAGRSIAVADLAKDHSWQHIAGGGLAGQGNAPITVNDTEDVVAIRLDLLDERPVAGRCQLVEKYVLNLSGSMNLKRVGSPGTARVLAACASPWASTQIAGSKALRRNSAKS